MFQASRSSSRVARSGRSLQSLLQHADSPANAAAAAAAAAAGCIGSAGATSTPHLPSAARGAYSLIIRGLHDGPMAPPSGITAVLSRAAASRMRSLPLPHQQQQQQRLLSSSTRAAAQQAAASTTTTATTTSSSSSSSSSRQSWGFLPWYLAQLEAHPVMTKALTSCTVFTLADITSQYLSHALEGQPSFAQSSSPASDGALREGMVKDLPAAAAEATAAATASFEWDAPRTMRMGAAGLILSGPTLHVWYGLMARWRPGRDLLSICQKITVGTVLYGPAFNAIFFSANGALQGEGSKEIAGRLRRDLVPTLVNGLMYWPFCDLATYRFVPVHLQPLANNGAAFLWTIYVTYMAGKAPPTVDAGGSA